MDNLSQGCFQISRSIFDSAIFSKPSDWFKVRIYIIGQMNFKDNGLPRGSKYMKYERIERDCKVSYNIITKIVVFLKKEGMISVKQATHGCVITVLNYAVYQDMGSYEGKPQANHRQTTGKPRVDDINKNERMEEGKEKKDTGDFVFLSPEVKDIFYEFIAHRKKREKGISQRAIDNLYSSLNKLSSDSKTQFAIIEQAIVKNWKGLFPLKYDKVPDKDLLKFIETHEEGKERDEWKEKIGPDNFRRGIDLFNNQ